MKTTLVPILICLVATSVSLAGDTKVPAPQGWNVVPFYHAATADNIAFGATQTDPPVVTKVTQHRSGVPITTDIAGKVGSLTYSADGQYLLVHHVTPASDGSAHGVPKISLLDSTGGVVWTKIDNRSFFFSTGSTQIYAWQASDIWEKSSELEVFSLAGNSLHVLDAGHNIRAALLLGSGEQIVVAAEHSLLCLSTSDSSTVWQINLAAADPPVTRIEALEGNRFTVFEYYGFFKIVGHDGTVEYSYNPKVLGDADPNRTPLEFAQYMPYSDLSSPGELVLFDGSDDGLQLSIGTAQISPRALYTSVPPGFTLRKSLSGGRLILLSTDEVRIRSVM